MIKPPYKPSFKPPVKPDKAPIPPNGTPCHPFNRPGVGSYGHPMPPTHDMVYRPQFPTSGNVRGSMFYLYNNEPYLVDNTRFEYGPYLIYSESVLTKVVRKNDASCLNLAATVDMNIDSTMTNMLLNNVLNETIVNQYERLNGILPIIKSDIVFKLHFRIVDMDGITVHQSSMSVSSQDIRMHFTDLQDRFVFSSKNLFSTTIPAVNYRGMYTIVIERLEAYMYVINSIEHTQSQANKFYTFIQENTKIALQHETIKQQEPDEMIMIASTDIGLAFNFQANLTTRMKFSFTAFIPTFIAAPDTFKVWCGLIDPRSALVRDLATQVKQLNEMMESMTEDIAMVKMENSELLEQVNDLQATVEDLQEQISKDNVPPEEGGEDPPTPPDTDPEEGDGGDGGDGGDPNPDPNPEPNPDPNPDEGDTGDNIDDNNTDEPTSEDP